MFQSYFYFHHILLQLSVTSAITLFLYFFVLLKKLRWKYKLYSSFISILFISLYFVFSHHAPLFVLALYMASLWALTTIAAWAVYLLIYLRKKLFRNRRRFLNPYQGSSGMKTSFGLKMRSKSEILIAEKLYEHKIHFEYEKPLSASGKTFYPDFTIFLKNKTIYWEHFGMLSDKEYHKRFKIKLKWYQKNFPNRLVWTKEEIDLLPEIVKTIDRLKSNKNQ